MKRYLVIALLTVFFVHVFANHPLVRNFTRKDYRSGTQNWAITQDENNLMYFANNNGLLVFDGKTWNTIPIKHGTNVRSIKYGGDGKFYASTFNEFGYFEKSKSGTFEYYSLNDKLGIRSGISNELYNIHLSDKNIIFQGEKNIYKYNGKKISKVLFNYRIDASAVVHNILFVASQQSGFFMLNGDLFVRIPGSELLINKKVCSILPYSENRILIVTSFDGVYLYNGLSIIPYSTGIDDFLKANQVFCATTNGKQIVYGTVQRGIAIQNITDNKSTFVNTYSGLQNNTVLSAAFDNQQNLWLGLDNGIDYVMLNSPIQNLFGTNNLYGAGYTSYLKNDLLYFGTNQGLYFTNYPLPNSPMPLQLKLIKGMEGQVWCLNEIDNTLFCGDDQGAFIIYPDRVERIEGLSGTWSFKKLQHRSDLILGCSYHGLFILKKISDRWVFSHFIKGKFNESSPMFEEDEDGSIWFSHWQKGLFRLYINQNYDSIMRVDLYNEKKGFPSNRNNTLFKVGNEIIFSSELGFYKYNNKSDKMEVYHKWNKMFSTPPAYMRLHESTNGDVWCVSGRFIGLARKNLNNTYTIDSLTYRILQPKILIGFEQFNFIDKYNVILNTEDGFSWVDMRLPQAVKSNFKVILNAVIVSDENSAKPEGRHFFVNPVTENKFYHSQNSLRFEFNAPEYRSDALVQYSCMLENYDKSWSEFSTTNVKEYTQLPSGSYVFKIRAHDLMEQNEVTTEYSFVIEPAWYETRIAFVIYLLLLLMLITAIILFVNHRSKKGAMEMEKIKEIEIQQQKKAFEEDTQAKKREIKELKNQQLQYELRHKSQELASSTMNLIRKNEMLLDIVETINKTTEDIRKNTDSTTILNRLSRVEKSIRQNIENDNNWKRFEENFDLVYENYLKRLGESYPELTVSDKKICAYIKMDLSSKDMAPLLNMSVRSIETNRYRIRKKLDLDREVNLSDFLQKF